MNASEKPSTTHLGCESAGKRQRTAALQDAGARTQAFFGSWRLLSWFVLFLLPSAASAQLNAEAISRELSVFNFGQPFTGIEAISREVSVFNFGQPAINLEAISREMSVFNFGQPLTDSEAISRELSIFNFGQPNYDVEAISREMSVSNFEPGVACTPPFSEVVAWWPGDGNAMDLAGTNHGTLLNGATCVSGLVGQAFSFDGVDDGVVVPDHPLWHLSQKDFTIQFWSRVNRIKNSMFLHQQSGAGSGGFEFDLQPFSPHGSILIFARDPANAAIYRPWSPTLGQWFHLAVTRAQGVYRIFADGVPLGSQEPDANSVADVVGGVRMGSYADDASFGVDGLMEEIAVFDRALTTNEIATLYAAGSAGMCKPALASTGTPRVLVNGRFHFDNVATVTNSALLRMESRESNAVIRYTLNGAPPAGGALYTGPLVVTQAVVVRAMAFNVAGVASPEADPVQVVVIAPPVFLLQPQNQLVGAGEDVMFVALAAGTPLPNLQWLRNGFEIAGATNAVLLLTNVLPGPPINFALMASNAFGVVTSAVARLDVLAPPTIIAQPASVTVTVGETATFTVSAFGPPPLQFQWRKNGANIEGATASTFTINSVQFDDGATYTVVIASPGGTLISNPALLTVTVPSPAANDNFAAANALSGASGSATGTNNFTTREVGEPLHAGKPGSNSVWYTWTATANGIATFRTLGSTFDTLLGVYVGANVAATTTVASDEDSGGFLTSKVRFNATNGVTYHIAIDGFNGGQGSFVLRWELIATNATLPEITCPPASRTVLAGQDAGFSVSANGAALTYQWFFNGAAIAGAASATYTRSNVQPEHVGFYSVRVNNASQQSVESVPAILEIGPFADQQSRDKTDDVAVSCPGGLRPASGGASSVAMGSIGSQVLVSVSTNNATDCNTTFCGGIPTGTRYLELSPAISGTFLLDTVGSASRTKLSICDAGTSRLAPRTFVECDVDSAPDGRSLVRFAAVGGRNYQVYIARLDEAVGVLRLNWKLGVPPRLVSLSSDRFVAEGTAMTLSVEATNMVALGVTTALLPPTYQWFFNGTLMATGSTFTVPQMQTAFAGQYRVVAANDLGTTSAVVRVEVHGETSRAVVSTGARTELFAADTTAACGAAPTTYQWRRNGTLLPGETHRSLLLSGAQPENAGEYVVTVINCFGSVSYTVASIAVTVDVGFEAEVLPGGLLALRWRTMPGKHYRVEFRASLDASAWTSLRPDITAAGLTEQLTDPLGLMSRFYRIVLLD